MPDQTPPLPESERDTMADLLTELRAIRSLLEQREQSEAKCPHGTSGVCMDCITPLVDYHLTVLSNGIANQAWEAMRRG